jgi:hypothetical protein
MADSCILSAFINARGAPPPRALAFFICFELTLEQLMRKAGIAVVLVIVSVLTGAAQGPQTPVKPDPAKEKRLEWFRDAKYGLFIHWGLYAIPAGEWKGQASLCLLYTLTLPTTSRV